MSLLAMSVKQQPGPEVPQQPGWKLFPLRGDLATAALSVCAASTRTVGLSPSAYSSAPAPPAALLISGWGAAYGPDSLRLEYSLL